MRVLVLGAAGMLGHTMCRRLSPSHDVVGTVRGSENELRRFPIFSDMKLCGNINAERFETVERIIKHEGPDVVVNCIGIIKQLKAANNPLVSITINALFPHQLAELCMRNGVRLIHFSTDCVFSGRKGNYKESDYADADDLYGRSKFLGEVTSPSCLTLRTSVIGFELYRKVGLLEWLMSQQGGTVEGYTNALYTGFTTDALAALVEKLICDFPDLYGVWHASSDPISKYDLLCMVNEAFDLGIEITPNHVFECDRRLDSSRFRQATGFKPPSWEQMIEDLSIIHAPFRVAAV